ncbi:MAG TPA: carbohydrate porin [Terriglobales bacterium]|nr:carbohydrate porin [Terriglobales bacterium]
MSTPNPNSAPFRSRRSLWLLALAATLPAQAPRLRLGPTTLSGQMNLVWQGYPAFPAAYSGPLSLPAAGEFRNTRVFTLMSATRVSSAWRIHLDLEAANGRPLGGATGLAGIANLDVTRNLVDSLLPSIYLARLYAERHRGGATLRIGRLDLADYFDQNAVLGDDHRQFLNWSTNVQPAWDYAADTRGYTDAVEFSSGAWRLAYALMPRTPNGMRLDWNSSSLMAQRQFAWPGATVRLFAYANHARLGQYDQAATSVDAHHRWLWKQGAGLSLDCRLAPRLRLGARLGTNNDAVEDYANTEAENSASVGLAARAGANRWGAALASNGLSAAHAAYLARGGLGFLLGDGALRYGRETIAEFYWTRPLGAFASWGPDLQWIRNPGYNRDRGPVLVLGWRVHADL